MIVPPALQDEALHQRFADALFAETWFDLRGRRFRPFYVADLIGPRGWRSSTAVWR